MSVHQVRDVLKGALKPTCLSDTESELGGYSWVNAALASGGVKRQLSESSAHRSVVSTSLIRPLSGLAYFTSDSACAEQFLHMLVTVKILELK